MCSKTNKSNQFKMDIDNFISIVFSKPPVWDKRTKTHRNRYVVDKCWMEISAKMNEDEFKLRKKWKYLREQFAIEFGKIPAPSSADEASTSYEPKWPYYHSLMFLKDIVKPRKYLKRHSPRASVEQNDNSYLCQCQYSPNTDQQDLNDPNDIEACDHMQHDTKDKSTHHERDENNLQKKQKITEEDENLLFLKSLLPHIRIIPRERLLSFRNDIQKTVDIYAYQSQFSRFPSSSLPRHSPEPHAIHPIRQTPEPHAIEDVSHPFHLPTLHLRHTPLKKYHKKSTLVTRKSARSRLSESTLESESTPVGNGVNSGNSD